MSMYKKYIYGLLVAGMISSACFGMSQNIERETCKSDNADFAKIRDLFDAIKELTPGTPSYSAACANIGNMYQYIQQTTNSGNEDDRDDQAETSSASDSASDSAQTDLQLISAKLKIVITYTVHALYTAAADIEAQVALHEPTAAELQSMLTTASEIVESVTRLGQDATQVIAVVQQITSLLNSMQK